MFTMISKKMLYGDSGELRRAVLQYFNKSDEEINEDVRILKEWNKLQPHLPEVMSDHRIECLLFLSKCSIERTKEKIDMYYTIRSLIPELFANPKLPHIKEMRDIIQIIPGTKLTDNFGRIYIARLNHPNIDSWDINHAFATCLHITEIRISEDYYLADHYILDFSQVKAKHIKFLSVSSFLKAATVLRTVLSNRVAGFHIINGFAIIEFIMFLAKSCLSAKLLQRVHVHKNIESLYEHVPRELLPKDYGGDDLPVTQLMELLNFKHAEYQDRFDVLDTLKVNEDLRPSELENDEILGYYGNFKQMNVD